MKMIVYTDGASRGNPGPGGWGCILITEYTEHGVRSTEQEEEVIEIGGGEVNTTNNRMELTGAIEALRAISPLPLAVSEETRGNDEVISSEQKSKSKKLTAVEVCTDSEYVKKGMTEWINGWIKNGWKTSTKKPVLNQELWQALHQEEARLKEAGIKVTWTYVPGHAGVALNERADTIATEYADSIRNDSANNLQLYRGPKEEYPYF